MKIPTHQAKPTDNQNVVPKGQVVVGKSVITGGPVVSGPKSSYRPPRFSKKSK